ncbi:Neurexin-3a Neurexin IIIa-alpha Neurexin-3a-alpha Precursor [Channa argus]|uniref:Neurexin-3a Neurexin IIIa-alpha Neurexin-3a-alpha n=1 Tax=Channa argus TaxID=215402 RepID=A0A6G1QG75_CHAAH|nr:Neurexin-3a Neurexin IIIa-alpha Neurexin-3a-alpha Precursor [Channa argus]
MGICIQQWENYTCDCSMTSYTGTQCNDHVTCTGHSNKVDSPFGLKDDYT